MSAALLHLFPGRLVRNRWIPVAVLALGLCVYRFTPTSATTPILLAPLLQKASLIYEGSFRVPQLPVGGFGAANGFDYATTGIAYNPQHDSLFINNHIYEQKTAEIGIPTLSTDMSNWSVAPLLQGFTDLAEGHLSNLAADGSVVPGTTGTGTYMGGLMVFGHKLIGTSYIFYDANHEGARSHFTSSLDLSRAGDFSGMYRVGLLNAGYYAGYMTGIPSEWQSSFGGPALTGNCCLAVIGRTSLGPSAFVFNPDDLGVLSPVPVTPLVYYPLSHPTLGTWDNQEAVNLYFNMGSAVKGVVFPVGGRTVLFFGRQGLGIPCYGEGGATPPEGAVHWCYDPIVSAKGNHAPPYKYWVWAYDAAELLAVKNGEKNPWDVRPYAVWPLDLPVDTGTGDIQGVAYDAASQRVYVSQMDSDGRIPGTSEFDRAPLIHAFHVDLNAPIEGSVTPIIGSVPANPTITQTAPDGAPFTFTVTATSTLDGTILAACTPPSGSTFPVGTTTVVCTATDHLGNSASKSFTVTVTGSGGPLTIDAVASVTREATGPAGAAIVYTAPAWHNSTTTGTATCAPASGATFPIGRTVVTCTASAGFAVATASFNVDVTDTTKPSVVITSPRSGVYLVGSRVPVSYSCADLASAIKLCQGAVASGADLDTSHTGVFTFAVHAVDMALNTFDAAVAYTVLNPTPLTWATPADISFGTALGPAQLNAVTTIPGSIVYTPPAGTVLNAGAGQELWVTFFPTDSDHYAPAAGMVHINVRQRIVVTAPNTSAALIWGTVRPITWTHGAGIGALFNIDISRDGGATWAPIATQVPAVGASTGSYKWPVSGPATSRARIRVQAAGEPGAGDISDVDFSIVAGAVTVTSPNGSGTLRIGDVRPISFTHNLGVGALATIDITRDGGQTWSTITSTATTTSATSSSYAWTISGPPTTRARVRVSVGAAFADMSDVDFTIAPPMVTVTSPNGAGTLRIGDVQNIWFTHNLGIGQTINLDVSTDDGASWSPIGSLVTASATSGTSPWTVNAPATANARVRVSWASDPKVSDTSDVNFAIVPKK